MVVPARSGQIAVAAAGTAVQGPTTPLGNLWRLTADPANTDTVYVGEDGSGDVSATTGYPLAAGDAITVQATKLSDLWFDAAVNGEKICWFRLS